MILEENDLDQFITREVPEPKGDEAKAAHKRSMAKAKRIIADSIKDHPCVFIQDTKGSIRCFDKDVRRKEHQPKYDFEEPIEECEDI